MSTGHLPGTAATAGAGRGPGEVISVKGPEEGHFFPQEHDKASPAAVPAWNMKLLSVALK